MSKNLLIAKLVDVVAFPSLSSTDLFFGHFASQWKNIRQFVNKNGTQLINILDFLNTTKLK
jgi:hypothetical protein